MDVNMARHQNTQLHSTTKMHHWTQTLVMIRDQ